MIPDPIAVWTSFQMSPEAPKTAMSALELDGYLTGIIVTPQAAPIRPGAWMARIWGDDGPTFVDEPQTNAALRAVALHYNTLRHEIDRSLARLEADRIVDYRPLFRSGDEKPAHDAVRAWVRGLWKAMELAPETWSALADNERTRAALTPFLGFFDGEIDPRELRADVGDLLDAHAAVIPRAILVLRKLARSRAAASRPPPRRKIGRNDPCPCGSGKKHKRCCGDAPSITPLRL